MFGFIAPAGDERTVMPITATMVYRNGSKREQASYTLPAIAHRIGREKVVQALAQGEMADRQQEVERTFDKLLQYPMDTIEDYFELYYRGMV